MTTISIITPILIAAIILIAVAAVYGGFRTLFTYLVESHGIGRIGLSLLGLALLIWVGTDPTGSVLILQATIVTIGAICVGVTKAMGLIVKMMINFLG